MKAEWTPTNQQFYQETPIRNYVDVMTEKVLKFNFTIATKD